MPMERVQMILEPRQRRKLAELAKLQGKSIAEVTRQAIDIGLQALDGDHERQRMLEVLEKAQQLRARIRNRNWQSSRYRCS